MEQNNGGPLKIQLNAAITGFKNSLLEFQVVRNKGMDKLNSDLFRLLLETGQFFPPTIVMTP